MLEEERSPWLLEDAEIRTFLEDLEKIVRSCEEWEREASSIEFEMLGRDVEYA